MTTEISLSDINTLQAEVELGARKREDSMESGVSSRPLHPGQMTASTSWGFKIVAVLVAILYIGIIVMVTNRPDKDDDEIVLSASASLKNRDYVGALYAGQGEWVDKLDMEVPVAGRSDHQVVACGSEGMLYILGGYTDGVGATVSDLVLEFDPASETYTTKASMPTPRTRFGAACWDGVIYVTGGFDNSLNPTPQPWEDGTNLDSGFSIATLEAYDVATDTWVGELSDMGEPRGDIAMAAVGGKLYTFMGYGYGYAPADAEVEIYDIASDVWSTGTAAAWNVEAIRGDSVAIAVGTDIYIFGGWIDNYPEFIPSTAAEKYDTVTGEWTQLADMLLARGDCAVAALGDKLYVIGGETRAWDPNLATDVAGEQGGWITNIPMHDVEQYDVANDVWIRMAPIPAPRFRFSAGASDQAIYTFGGHAQGAKTVDTVQAFYYVDRPNVFLHAKK